MATRILSTIRRTDWLLLGAVLVLSLFGLLNLAGDPSQETQLIKQAVFIVLGVGVFYAASHYDYRFLSASNTRSMFIWGVGAMLLAGVTFLGPTVRGAANWLYIGPLSIDPIEIVKLGVLVALAATLSRSHERLIFFHRILPSAVIVIVPIALAMLQPDLGSAIVLAALWFGTVVLLRLPLRSTVLLIVLVLLLVVTAWNTLLLDYQKDRLLAFVNPAQDPMGAGYQTRQALIAVGAGGLTGRGFFTADLSSNLDLLPESASDFAFASLIEQSGLLGALLILSVFGLILTRIERVVRFSTNNFSAIYAMALMVLLVTEVGLHVGMNIGLLPVTGLPLPFVSYGGSHTLVTFAMLGLLESIRLHQPELQQESIEPLGELSFD